MSTFSSTVVTDVHLRLPLWMRIYGIVFSIFWFGMFGVMIVLIISSGEPVAAVMPVFMGILGALMVSRAFRIGVRSSGDNLVVCNYFSTRTFRPGQIKGFRAGRWISPFHLVISVITGDDNIVPLHVTMHTPLFGKGRAHDQLVELEAWHAQGPTTR